MPSSIKIIFIPIKCKKNRNIDLSIKECNLLNLTIVIISDKVKHFNKWLFLYTINLCQSVAQ